MLSVKTRDPLMKAQYIRSQRQIPAVCYGKGIENLLLQMDYQSFKKLYDVASSNTLVDLQVEDHKQPLKVLVHDVQYHPVSGDIDHVDFLHVRMDEEVTAHISLKFVGVSPAVKELGAVLVTYKHEFEIRCLPKDLIHEIEVDISALLQFHDAIHIKDLTAIPSGITVMDNLDDVIVSVVPPRVEEEEVTPVAEAPLAPEGEGVKEGDDVEAKEEDVSEKKRDR